MLRLTPIDPVIPRLNCGDDGEYRVARSEHGDTLEQMFDWIANFP
jgi:hypothetical protein